MPHQRQGSLFLPHPIPTCRKIQQHQTYGRLEHTLHERRANVGRAVGLPRIRSELNNHWGTINVRFGTREVAADTSLVSLTEHTDFVKVGLHARSVRTTEKFLSNAPGELFEPQIEVAELRVEIGLQRKQVPDLMDTSRFLDGLGEGC